MPTPEALDRFIARTEPGAHGQAILEFSTEQASMQKNRAVPRAGREAPAKTRTRTVHSHSVQPVLQQGDRVVIRGTFPFERLDGRGMLMEELAYQGWQGQRLARERFFYDPARLQARPA